MAKKAKIKNSEKELPIDFTIQKEGEHDWHTKTLAADSETKLEEDKGTGAAMTLRFFQYAANPEAFAKYKPTANELFSFHVKQIQIELWKDEWEPILEIPPRLMFSADKKSYTFTIAAKPSKGSRLSIQSSPQVLSDLVTHGNGSTNSN